ncbi:cytochrome P450 [Punctularia strigosozonata HHB-11173 SS5]|uniref:cytochrome P450 n=1 Tax=Punctularia strigosozonata (strain HHB-11173) TaxID=741275 RepID=UPI00044186B2|nr:cytochrome P450 [Punctularia strigosozonata HHB-11173 SS5]EIN14252.1 cytochrome P450 [Punctularia strigosozonata HHB-11173 SS5]
MQASFSNTSVWVSFAFTVGIVVFISRRIRLRSPPLPPGPPGHWLFGTTVPLEDAWRINEEWTQQYGPVFSYRQGTRRVVVIGRHQAAVDILEKDGAVTLDRPENIPVITASGGLRVINMSWNDQTRKLRRAMHDRLRHKVATTYGHIQEENSRNLILDILDNPDAHQVHVRRYAASVILRIAYGKTTPTYVSDPEVQHIIAIVARMGRIFAPGSLLVDRIPFLRHVPGILDEQKAWHKDELGLFRGKIDAVREAMAHGRAEESFAKFLLTEQAKLDISDDEMAYLAGSLFGAGSDTTASVLGWVIQAAAVHPQAQARVQDELDRVLGRERAPNFEDEDALPQVTAFMLEVYRWRPTSIIGFAHRVRSDIRWRDFLIPADSTILGSHWSIAHDPDVWHSPDRFDPGRWLDEEGKILKDKKTFMFGFGRRVCPGQHVANRSVFINTAMLLWSFHIKEDPANPINTMDFRGGTIMHPSPFKVVFENRIQELKSLITDM